MSKIVHKKSAVVGKVPLSTDLDFGELAINYADGFLYYKASNNTVQKIKADVAGGSGLSTWQSKTANYTAVAGDRILANTTGGSFTITLPATPSLGDQVVVADPSDWGVNSLTIARNGSTIEGLAENFVLDVKGVDATLVYDGTTWQVFSSLTVTGGGVVPNRQIFTATANQTTFTVNYLPQYIDVYLNGVKLVNGQDFVATNGTTVVLSVGAALGDLVEVVAGIWMDAGVVDFASGTVLGQLAIASGGTGASTAQAAFNNLAPSQVGNSGKYLKTDGTNASWDTIEINTADITGTLPVANGGTGLSSFTTGDLLYASAATTLAKLSGVQAGSALLSGGVGTAPVWGKIGLQSHVNGVLPVANGGTNLTSVSAQGVFYASSGSTFAQSNNLTFDGTTLTAANFIDSSLTSGRVTYAGVGGNLTDSANLIFTGTNLGVGESTPLWRLVVRKDDAGVGTGDYPAVQVNNANATGFSAVYLNDSSAQAGIETRRDTAHLALRAGGGERARIDNTGNFGIGTTSPSFKLVVNSNSATPITNGLSTNDVTLQLVGKDGANNRLLYQSYGGINNFLNAFAYGGTLASPSATTAGTNIFGISIGGYGTTTALGGLARLQFISETTFTDTSAPTCINFQTAAVGTVSAADRMRITGAGDVGIGTTAPSAKLHINQSSAATGLLVYTNDIGSANIVNFQGFDNSLGVVSRMVVQANGNVGIGTTSPATRLHVDASGGGVVRVTRLGASASAYGQIEHDGTNTTLTSSAATIFNAGGGTERARITSGGNLCVGTTSSAYRLGVTTSSGAGIQVITAGATTNNPSQDWYDSTNLTEATLTTGNALVSFGTYTNTPLAFITNNTERARIDASGNLGIGTNSPGGNIHVNTTGNTSVVISAGSTGLSRLIFQGQVANNRGFIDYDNTTSVRAMIFRTNEAEVMRLDASGNLGVGTNSPSRRLNISGAGTNCAIRIDNTVSGRPALIMYDDSQNLTITNSSDTGYIGFINGTGAGTERARITSDGNLLLGTTSNAGPKVLVVAGAPVLRLEESTTGGSKRLEFGVTSGGLAYIGANQSAQDLVFQTVGSERMRITSTGAIGIGTTSPSETIFVQTPSTYGTNYIAFSDRTTLTSGDSDAGGIKWYDYGGAAASIGFKHNAYFGSAPRAITFNISGSERARITNSGYLGIGTTSPLAPLVVCSPNNENIEFGVGNVGLNGGYIEYINRNTASTRPDFSFYIANSFGSHKFYTTATERLRINASGNVGIGTSNPTSRLHVVSAGNTTAGSASFYFEGGTHDGVASPNNMQYGLYLTQGGARYTGQCGIYSVVGETRPNNNGTYGGPYFGIQGIAEVSTQAGQPGTGVYGQSGSAGFNYAAKQIGVQGVSLPGYSVFYNTYGLSANNGGFGGHFVAHGKADSCGVYADAYLDASPGAGVLARPLVCGTNGSFVMYVMTNGGIANYSSNDTNLSDIREKRNIQLAPNYLDKICAIPIKTFRYNNEDDTADITLGVIAQDVQAVAPEFVTEDSWPTPDEPDRKRLSVYQTDLQFAMMKCIQELNTKLDAALAKIAELEAK